MPLKDFFYYYNDIDTETGKNPLLITADRLTFITADGKTFYVKGE